MKHYGYLLFSFLLLSNKVLCAQDSLPIISIIEIDSSDESVEILTTTKFFNETQYDSLKEVSIKLKKPILLDFWMTSCIPCRQMDKYVYNDSLISKFLNEHYICIKINCDRFDGMDVMDDHKVIKKPTIIIKNNNNEMFRKVGYIGVDEIKIELEKYKGS
jgi:thiol-disulfide isomerase/thioredoxin